MTAKVANGQSFDRQTKKNMCQTTEGEYDFFYYS